VSASRASLPGRLLPLIRCRVAASHSQEGKEGSGPPEGRLLSDRGQEQGPWGLRRERGVAVLTRPGLA